MSTPRIRYPSRHDKEQIGAWDVEKGVIFFKSLPIALAFITQFGLF